RPAFYDDDDDDDVDYTILITPNETVDSLIMGDEHLDTVPATESDELIKSSVENLSLHNEDFSEKIFSNPLFEEEINSMRIGQHHSNVESDLIGSLHNHDSSIIPSFSKIDSLLDEFTGELTLLKSISPGVDKTDCYPENEIRFSERLLYDNSSPRPPEEFVFENSDAEIESFSPSPIPNKDSDSFMEEIYLFLTPDDPMPPSIEDDEDSEGDIVFLERLLHDDLIPLLNIPDFSYEVRTFLPFFTYLVESNPIHNEDLDSTPKNDRFDTKSYLLESLLNRDESIPPGIDSDNLDSEGDTLSLEILLHDDPIPLSDTLDFDFSNFVRVFLPFFTYPVTSSILLSSGSEDTIFDPGIYHFSSLEPDLSHRCGTFKKFNTRRSHLNESPMEMLFSTCSPMDQ
nr:hypothetical protein [Tanacetum cinerariifolium]